MNRWLPLMNNSLERRLDGPNLRALDWLESSLSELTNVECNEHGDLVAQKDYAEFTMHVVGSLLYRFDKGDFHLDITVKARGYPRSERSVCLVADKNHPVGDHILKWVCLVESGWPEDYMVWQLQEAVKYADWYVNTSGIPEKEKLAEAAAKAKAEAVVALAEDCAGGLYSLAEESRLEEVGDLWNRAYKDASDGVNITSDLLVRAVQLAAGLIGDGINADAVNMALTPFFDRYSFLTINAFSRKLSGSPEGEVLQRYKTSSRNN